MACVRSIPLHMWTMGTLWGHMDSRAAVLDGRWVCFLPALRWISRFFFRVSELGGLMLPHFRWCCVRVVRRCWFGAVAVRDSLAERRTSSAAVMGPIGFSLVSNRQFLAV